MSSVINKQEFQEASKSKSMELDMHKSKGKGRVFIASFSVHRL